ncbi:MAG: alpha/beta hydrolase, partial [Alphaproteobacteria bacterium]|nr:alpha/beta hydrolase [Alphaproteobacteria bacterium]
LPDSDYAALDVCEAVEKIRKTAGKEKIDILGWSWGTVISSHFAYVHPEYINKLVLYAPIFTGLGYSKITEPFHQNDWEHAADDFQKKSNGTFDFDITEKEIIEMYCSSCWHYDGT